MSSRMATYCNITTDLFEVDPDIEVHDQKRVIRGWETVSGNICAANNVGYIGVLFASGEDLGDAEDAVGDVNAEGEWFYDADEDKVTYYGATSATTIVMEGGEDWVTLKTRAVQRASEVVKSFVNRPILKQEGTGQQTPDSRSYPWVITHSTACIAVSLLMRDKSLAAEVRKEAINPNWGEDIGESPGWLDQIKNGTFKLWNEIGLAEKEGDVREVSIDSDSTGTVIDTHVGSGGITTAWDVIELKIDTGGTVTEGTVNETVTFTSKVSNGTMIKYTTVASEAYIQLDYQHIGWNVYVRFGPGVYTADDEWEVEVSSMDEEHGKMSSISLTR